MTFRVSTCGWLAAAALAGCASETQYAGDVHVASPELVAIEPGVEVVADADEPVFYAEGSYWLYRDEAWLRSDSFRTGFVRIDVWLVPDRLRRIPEPRSYAHYRRIHQGEAYARGGQIPDHRRHPPTPPQPSRPAHPNPMPGQPPTTPEPQRPQGAETGTTPQTGGQALPQDRSAEPGQGLDQPRDLDPRDEEQVMPGKRAPGLAR
jgi:hypothetical protein